MSKELKVCSECGCKSAVLVAENAGIFETFFVQCTNCKIIGPKQVCDFSEPEPNRAKAIAAARQKWNDGLF
jgi:hypothetical protein